MPKQVKGTVFVEYVRAIRALKDVDFSDVLTPQDMPLLEQQILPASWYPWEAYERMGLGLNKVLIKDDMERVRLWGRMALENLARVYRGMVREGDPQRSLVNFTRTFASFFNFPCFESHELSDTSARLEIFFPTTLEEGKRPSSYQALGTAEGLLEKAGAQNLTTDIQAKHWQGAPKTLAVVSWSESTAD